MLKIPIEYLFKQNANPIIPRSRKYNNIKEAAFRRKTSKLLYGGTNNTDVCVCRYRTMAEVTQSFAVIIRTRRVDRKLIEQTGRVCVCEFSLPNCQAGAV